MKWRTGIKKIIETETRKFVSWISFGGGGELIGYIHSQIGGVVDAMNSMESLKNFYEQKPNN